MADTTNDLVIDPKTWFSNLYNLYESGLNGHKSDPIAQFRKKGFDELNTQDFPSRKNEDWKYTSVTPIISKKYLTPSSPVLVLQEASELSSLDAHSVSYVNGKLDGGLPSIEGVTIIKTEDALKVEAYRNWIYSQLEKNGGTTQNTFLPLNQAFASDGLFIKVDKNVEVDKPLYIQYDTILGGNEPFFVNPQLFIWMEQSSRLEIVERYESIDTSALYMTNTANRIEVLPNAKLLLLKIQHESFGAYQINNTIVNQHRDSTFYHYAVDTGGQIVRNNLSIELLGSNTETYMYGAFIGHKDQHIDNQTFIDHAVPHCQSNEMYKGILTDKARGVFNGKVLVRQDAQKTNAYQQSSSLVLSPTAIMDTKPQLEIFADDVKCSHGATIGHIDESSMFYLQSRGLNESQAKSLLKRAFISEVLDHIDNEDLRDFAYGFIEEKLNLMQI
jgi:Fe-S cluster assembly protein SufD